MSNIYPPSAFDSAMPALAIASPGIDPDARLKGKLRAAVAGVTILVVGFGAAAALVPIGGAVIGAGEVTVASRVKRIAHPTGGVIAQIMVANGDHVVRGQPLIRLDDSVAGVDAAYSSLSLDQLLAQRARLEAERTGASTIAFPRELAARKDGAGQQVIADEQRLFALRRTEQASTRGQLAARAQQYRQEITGYRAQISALQTQQALIAPERRGVRALWEKDLVTIDRMNQLERTAADLTGNIAALHANIAQANARISEVSQQIGALGDTRQSDAGTQLAQVNAALNQQQVRNATARDQQQRTVLRAPVDGVVNKLTASTIGGVIRNAEPVLEIVPDHDRKVVEATISPTDIDQVRKGQPVRIRFSAFNSQTSPEVMGHVIFIAPERTVEVETQRSYYPVRIAIDPSGLARLKASSLALKPGMPAEIYIETGSRSMLSYLMKPLRDQLARAFRDN